MRVSNVKAAIYARISETDPDQDKVADQVKRCRALSKTLGATVVQVFTDDGISAYKGAERPAWSRMLLAIMDGDYDLIIADEEERFARGNGNEKRDLQAACSATSTTWHTVKDGPVDPSTAAGGFMSDIRDAFGRLEVARKSERQRVRNEARVGDGTPLEGKRRFGYEPDHTTPRETEAKWVRFAYDQMDAGKSLYSIQQAFNGAGVTGSYGYTWDSPKLRKLLLNPRNRGALIHRGVEQTVSKITPLVEAEQFERVRAVLTNDARRSNVGRPARVGLVSGIAVCGVCGGPLSTATNTQRGKKIELYKCRLKAHGGGQGTTHPSIRRALIDDAVMWEVYSYVLRHPQAEAEESATIGALAMQLEEVNRRRSLAQELALEPGADVADFRKRVASFGKDAAALEARIERERGNAAAVGLIDQIVGNWYDSPSHSDWLADNERSLQGWADYWAGIEFDRKRALIRSMFNIILNRGNPADDRVKFDWK